MRLRDVVPTKHIHLWRLYTPQCDDPDVTAFYFEMPAPPNPEWTYRRCDCGEEERCRTSALKDYPRDFRAFADETWIPVYEDDDPDELG
jgi:hypothetical protein